MPFGMVMEVTSFICPAVHSRSIYLLNIVISQLSQVLDPSPQGDLLQQILKCLLGNLTGPDILIFWFLALETNWFVTCWIAFNLLPLKVILVLFSSESSTPYFFVSLSAIFWLIFNIISLIYSIFYIKLVGEGFIGGGRGNGGKNQGSWSEGIFFVIALYLEASFVQFDQKTIHHRHSLLKSTFILFNHYTCLKVYLFHHLRWNRLILCKIYRIFPFLSCTFRCPWIIRHSQRGLIMMFLMFHSYHMKFLLRLLYLTLESSDLFLAGLLFLLELHI